ncbi:MAG: hypothetical protein KDD82_26600 [Planctomycetes bacterium]|nr:hypothetical protein [Planctomycetota bacterium]
MTVPLSSEWPRACIPLGVADDQRWSPIGSGVLIVQRPGIWLVTLERVLPPPGVPVSAWVSNANEGTLFDIADLHAETNLEWIRAKGWAATLFPVKPEWGTKGFNQQQSLTDMRLLTPLVPCSTVQCLYGAQGAFASSGPGTPYVLSGTISRSSPEAIFTSTPLYPRNTGAPVFATLGTKDGPEVRLIGLTAEALPGNPSLSPLTAVQPISQAFELLGSEAAQTQLQQVMPPA